MSGGGELMGMVAEAEFQGAEQLSVGGIDEFLGHGAEGGIGRRAELFHEGTDAAFTVFGGRRSSRGWGVQHDCHLAVRTKGENGFRTLPTAYSHGRHFPPKFVNCTLVPGARDFHFATSPGPY